MAPYFLRTVYPPGHFYSPIVDPGVVGEYHRKSVAKEPAEIAGIRLSIPELIAFWHDNIDVIRSSNFHQKRSSDRRYHEEGGPFPYGDAAILRAFIATA